MSSFLLNAVSANTTGPTVDQGPGVANGVYSVNVQAAGTVTGFSVQLQGSNDNFGTNTPIGAAITTRGNTRITSAVGYRYVRAVLSGYTGSGNVTVRSDDLPSDGHSLPTTHVATGAGPTQDSGAVQAHWTM